MHQSLNMTSLNLSSGSKIVPTDQDVLTTAKVAIARRFDDNPGNRLFKAVIESKKDTYQHPSFSRSEKSNLIESVIDLVHNSGGRFLCIDDSTGEWSVLSQRRMTDKIAHALRKKTRHSILAITTSTGTKKRSRSNSKTTSSPATTPTSEKRKLLITPKHQQTDDVNKTSCSVNVFDLMSGSLSVGLNDDSSSSSSSSSEQKADVAVSSSQLQNLWNSAQQEKRAKEATSNVWLSSIPLTFDVLRKQQQQSNDDTSSSSKTSNGSNGSSSSSSQEVQIACCNDDDPVDYMDCELDVNVAEEVLELLSVQ